MIVIIPCGGRKLGRRAAAAELYVGSYFRACLRYALARAGSPARVLILSAKHGFIRLDQELDPYDERLTRPELIRRGFLDVLATQARSLGLSAVAADSIEIIGGRTYVYAARAVLPQISTPMPRGLGIGAQLHWVTTRAAELEELSRRRDIPEPETSDALWDLDRIADRHGAGDRPEPREQLTAKLQTLRLILGADTSREILTARYQITPAGRAALDAIEERERLEAAAMHADAIALGEQLAEEREEAVFQVPATLEGFRYRRIK